MSTPMFVCFKSRVCSFSTSNTSIRSVSTPISYFERSQIQMSVSRRAVLIVRSFFPPLVFRSFCRLMPATVASSRSAFSFITFLSTRNLALHELGSMKVCCSTFCAAAWQLPLVLCLAVSVFRVFWTGWNNGRWLLNSASHIGNYVRMFVLYTHVVYVWIYYDSWNKHYILDNLSFHIHTVHLDIIRVFCSTDAQVNCLKNNFKIHIKTDIKTAPTCFGAVTPSSGSALFDLAKVTFAKIIN